MRDKLVILGAGESGMGVSVLAKINGIDVFISDIGPIREKNKKILYKYGIDWEEGKHSEHLILDATEIVKSPGIPDHAPIMERIRNKGIQIVSEIEFAGRYTNARKICITGSNGKTTTTSLIYHMIKKAGLNAGIAGNVGKSFAKQVAECDYDYYVIELSSFQLDGMYDFKADIAILLNITPDHLDRYGYDMHKYVESKFRIIQNHKKNDFFIYCSDDEIINNQLEKLKPKTILLPFSIKRKENQTAFISKNQIFITYKNKKFTMSIHDLALSGKHNIYNTMAAAIAGNILNIRKEIIRESLSDFQGVEHRLEPVIKVQGIQFINDSKATNVNSTWYALESMSTKVIWIVGGIDKGNDYSTLINLVKEKVKVIVCLGKDNAKIHKAFSEITETIVDTYSMAEAVKTAYYLGNKGDTVLLSPACASFDLFENYEDRGRQFKQAVRDL
jgi:UDP-N-acetylmuramoylalanine--D-glutamate ligase